MTTAKVTASPVSLAPLLSINEVASLLGISRKTLYALIHRGDLAPIRVGERLRFEQADVRTYLERNRESAPEMREPDLRRAQDSRDDSNGHDSAAT